MEKKDFNSYGARRGNHEVMMRGTFANIRLRNEMAPGTEGGWSTMEPGGEPPSRSTTCRWRTRRAGTPLVIIAGKEYGTGSSRDWAAKGTMLLGVRAVIAESFERIHRSNLVGMGVLPLEFTNGDTRQSLGLTGFETFDIVGLDARLKPRATLTVQGDGPRRRGEGVQGLRAHRHAGGDELLQERRHSAVRAAPARRRQIVARDTRRTLNGLRNDAARLHVRLALISRRQAASTPAAHSSQ